MHLSPLYVEVFRGRFYKNVYLLLKEKVLKSSFTYVIIQLSEIFRISIC